MSRAPLVVAAVVLAAGILLGIERPVPIGGGPFVLGLAVGGAIAMITAAIGLVVRPAATLSLLAVAGVSLGTLARAEAGRSCAAMLPADLPVAVEGVVESAAGPRLRLRLASARIGTARLECAETVSARWSGTAAMAGDAVAGTGRWWRPSGSGGLRPAGVLMLDTLYAAADGGGSGVGRGFARTRGAAARRLDALYGARGPLASSMLLAQRDGLDRDVRDRFARAGLAHLLAISGLHVGLVAGLLLLAGRLVRLGAGVSSLLAGAGTVCYVLFLGAPAAASRAALQVVLLLLAAAVQRPARSEAVVAAAALVLLALHPASLTEPGFQLSFAGVAGLLALRRPLLARMRSVAAWKPGGVAAGRWLADGVATGLAATLATAPIVAWHFGRVAPVGVVANLAAIPLVAALVPTLALSLLCAAVWTPAGAYLAGAGGLLLAALERVAGIAAALPGASVSVLPITAATWTAASFLAYVGTRRMGSVRPAIRAAAAAGLLGAVVALAPVRVGDDRLELHVIDVGQGDAIALRSPAGRWLLVDAGLAGAGYDAGERRVVPYLGARGVGRLEGLVLTHPHADHIGGAVAVIRTLRPGWVGDPGVEAGHAGYLEVLEAAVQRDASWIGLVHGAEIDLDGVTVEFLHPWSVGDPVEDPNDASVVLRIVYGEFSALLTGDAPAFVEEALVRRVGAGLEAEVLKAGHHGSSTSTSTALLQATGARVALISAGRGNRYGHPHRAVVDRLERAGVRVFRTDRDGSIVIRAAADGTMDIERERERR